MTKYKQYNLLLDPNDEDELILIKFLEGLRGNKRKNSFSAILQNALKVYMKVKVSKGNKSCPKN